MEDKSRIHALILPRTGFCMTDSLALAAAVLGPLAVYVLTLSHAVALEDDGLFLMAGAHLGIAHPPGYPIYTLILHLFMQLPFGTPAFLGHLSSAVLGALACGGVYLCARLLGAAALPALAASWLFGVSEHVWSQSIIAEVYALNSLFFFAVYALLLYGLRDQQRLWVWIAAAACYGMSLANHWPLMVLATPGLFLLILPARKAMFRRLPMLSGVAALGAVVPYVWMFLRAQQNPKISFYGSMNGLGDLWYHISRKGYSHFYKSSAGLDDHLGFLQWFAGEITWQLTLPAFFLAMLGLAILLRRRQLAEAGSGLVVFLGQSLVLIMLISFHFNYIQPWNVPSLLACLLRAAGDMVSGGVSGAYGSSASVVAPGSGPETDSSCCLGRCSGLGDGGFFRTGELAEKRSLHKRLSRRICGDDVPVYRT